eukprot:7406625-Alexandrium_andersonii.AAC.1
MGSSGSRGLLYGRPQIAEGPSVFDVAAERGSWSSGSRFFSPSRRRQSAPNFYTFNRMSHLLP